MNPDDLQAYLAAHGLAAELVRLDAHTPTVEAAAQVMGTTVDRIVKSVLFLLAGPEETAPVPVLVIANGLARVDDRRVAAHLGVSRRKLKLAGPDEVLAHTGYPVGGVPPLGHRTRLRTLIDPAVLAQPEVYAGGGAVDALLRLTPSEIVRATAAEPLAERPAPA
ncbi:MAG: YbaK/EbsC family protein [Anaerolineales bacterium]|nr:YbaK/EbsC family protein [Anaerolineales bacterium]